jgi:hypothetical protein
LLIGQDLDVGEARSIIDADMHRVVASTAVLSTAIACDAMTDPVNASESLGVDVQ